MRAQPNTMYRKLALFIDGPLDEVGAGRRTDVLRRFDASMFGTLPAATRRLLDKTLAAAAPLRES
jgi:hypothetical protein